jgi:S-adenosylmethionine uptake transporter
MLSQRAAAFGSAIFAIAFLSAMDATAKRAGATVPVLYVVFMRYLTGFLAALVCAGFLRTPWPTRGSIARALLRSACMIGTVTLFFFSLKMLPLAQAVALTFTSPFFLVIGASLMLGEPISRRTIVATLIGFSGILVLLSGRLSGGDGGAPLGYALALASSVTYAISTNLTRRDSTRDDVPTMILAQNLALAVLTLPFGAVAWVPLGPVDIALLALTGTLGTLGHYLFAYAYSKAGANLLAPLEFTAFLWAVLFGIVFFHETPTAWTLAGTFLIVAGCLTVIRTRSPSAV